VSWIDPPTAARIAGVPIIDYGRAESSGVLIAAGAGLGSALMDAGACLRWYADFDALRLEERSKEMFVRLLCEQPPDPLVVAGWWTVTSPVGLFAGLAAARDKSAIWFHGDRTVEGVSSLSLAQLCAQLQRKTCTRAAPAALRVRVCSWPPSLG
jgi:hypothetical protein